MNKHTFDAVLERPNAAGTWTFLTIPFDVAAAFGARGQVKVHGTINGRVFRSSAMPHGNGAHYLVVNKTIRDQIGATQGDTVTVTLEADTGERTVAVPADFQQALKLNRTAQAIWDAFSYTNRKLYIEWLDDAKAGATRARRITTAVQKIAQGLGQRDKSS